MLLQMLFTKTAKIYSNSIFFIKLLLLTPVNLSNRSCRKRLVFELRQQVPPVLPQLRLHHLVHLPRRHEVRRPPHTLQRLRQPRVDDRLVLNAQHLAYLQGRPCINPTASRVWGDKRQATTYLALCTRCPQCDPCWLGLKRDLCRCPIRSRGRGARTLQPFPRPGLPLSYRRTSFCQFWMMGPVFALSRSSKISASSAL